MGRRKTKIHIADNLSFSTNVITEVIDLIAKRGSGKTYTATKIAEEMLLVGAQVVVVDPVGNWYGLRLGAKGKSEGGLPINILGGRHGDIPLEYTSGALVARTIVDTGMSAILDVSMLSKIHQRRFITDFSAALLEFRKKHPSAMHLFWEEAYRFMPQRMTKGSQGEMLEATEELVTMGRNYGIGSTIIALRSALISKNVLTQAGILIAMHTNAPSDRAVIDSWMDRQEIDKEDRKPLRLAHLQTGDAYVWWPEEFGLKRVHVATKRTYDASSTPKFGEKSRHRKLKPVDLGALESAMSDTLERAKEQDPRLLRRRIAELEKRLAQAEKAPKPRSTGKRARDAIRQCQDALESSIQDTERFASLLDSHKLRSLSKTLRGARSALTTFQLAGETKIEGAVLAAPGSSARSSPQSDTEIRITAGALRMLKALGAVFPGGLTKKQVATAARMRSSSGTFGTYWSKLNVAGFIEGRNGRFSITAAGLEYLGDDVPAQPDSPDEKVEFWCQRLPGKAKELLRFLLKHRDEKFSKAELGEAVGLVHTSGTFGTYLSALTANHLATRDGSLYSIGPDLLE